MPIVNILSDALVPAYAEVSKVLTTPIIDGVTQSAANDRQNIQYILV